MSNHLSLVRKVNDLSRFNPGDTITDSPRGPGSFTGMSDAGYPRVDHITVTWVIREDGAFLDKLGQIPREVKDNCIRKFQEHLKSVI